MSARRIVSAIVVHGLLLAGATGLALAQLEKPSIKFSQGWLFQATQAQFPLAYEKGYWKSQGLNVEVDRGSGSAPVEIGSRDGFW